MQNQRRFTIFLFAFYFALLTWIIVFKMQFSFSVLQMPAAKLNVIPLAGSSWADGSINWDEVVKNILIFLPAGVYLAMLLPTRPFLVKLLPAFLTSLAYETLQFLFCIGVADSTDLLGNTLGAAAGILIFLAFYRIFGEKAYKIVNISASACTVLAGTFLALILLANL